MSEYSNSNDGSSRDVTIYKPHELLTSGKGIWGRGWELKKLEQDVKASAMFKEMVRNNALSITFRLIAIHEQMMAEARLEDAMDELKVKKLERRAILDRINAETEVIRSNVGVEREMVEADIRMKNAEALLKELEAKREELKMDLEKQLRKVKEKYHDKKDPTRLL